MRNSGETRYSFGTVNTLDEFEQRNDDGVALVCTSKSQIKVPLFVAASFSLFATSHASADNTNKQLPMRNPITCLSEMVKCFEQVTSLSRDDKSLESFLQHAINTPAIAIYLPIAHIDQELSVDKYTLTLIDAQVDYGFLPEHEYTIDVTINNIEEGDVSFDEDNILINTSFALV